MVEPAALTPGPAGGQQPLNLAGARVVPQFDVADILPPAAADRLRALKQRSSDSHALMVPYEDIRAASDAKIAAQHELTRLQAHPQDFGFNLKPGDRRVIEATKTLDKATDEFQRLQARQATRTAAWQSCSQALAACELWLRGRPGGAVLEDWDGPAPQLLKGEKGLLDAIENRRRRVKELRADLARLAAAPMPSGHAKSR